MKFLEISVKHYINDISNQNTSLEREVIFDDQPKPVDHGLSIKIDKFPAQFKKNIFQSVDKRFFFILLCSFVLNIAAILVLEKVLPSEASTRAISRIQEQYAKLLLNNIVQPSSYLVETRDSDYNLDTQLITGLNRWMDSFTDDILESIKDMPAIKESAPSFISNETKLPSREELGAARKSANLKRQASREELEKELNSVGLLGLISSNSRTVDQEYVQDLLEYASENSAHLGEVLAKLNSIEVPRYGSNGYLKKIRSGSDHGEAEELKGGRTTAEHEVQEIINNVEPIQSVEIKPMKRNVIYEEVPSASVDKMADLNLKGKTRSAQEVIRVVQSHTRALQDCYKQELRYDPTINGKILVRFTIDPDGNVNGASIVSSTLNSPRMEECILNRIKRWRNFPHCDPAVGDKTYRQSFSFGDQQ